MDEYVKDLLNRVRGTAQTVGEMAGSTARRAGQCAGNVLDITKLNLQVFDLNSEVSALLKDAGQIVYDAHLGLETSDEALAQTLKQLDVKNAEIAELQDRIALMKNSRECPQCGAVCGKGDRFCKACGTEL